MTPKRLRLSAVILGHLTFGVLLVLSILFYQERTLYTDTGFQLWELINQDGISIASERYSAILPKIPMYLGVEMGLSLPAVLITYSVTLILLYYGIFLHIVYRWKNVAAGLAVALVLVLCIRTGFYHAVNENHLAAVCCCWFWAWLYRPEKENSSRWKSMIMGVFIVAFAFFAHPVIAFVVSFLAGYYILDKWKWKSVYPYLGVAAAFVLSVGKWLFTPKDSYEGEFLREGLAFDRLLANWTDLPMVHLFLFKFEAIYILPTLMLAFAVVYLAVKKRWLLMSYLALGVLAVVAAVVVAFGKGDSNLMIEARWVIPSAMAVLPFTHLFLRSKVAETQRAKTQSVTSSEVPQGRSREDAFERRKWIPAALALTFIAFSLVQGLRAISKSSRFHTKRLAYLETLIEDARAQGLQKAWVHDSQIDQEVVGLNWAVPYETMMLSALQSPDSVVTITVYSDAYVEAIGMPKPSPTPDRLLVQGFANPKAQDDLNSTYFHFREREYAPLYPD